MTAAGFIEVGRRSMPRAQPNGNPSHQGRRSGGRLVIGALPIIAILASALPASGQQMQREPLAIVTASGDVHSFEVEIARTPDEQARGLMFRRTLAPDAGMLFLHAKDGRQSMWMKNTLIPLDMLFIRRNGGISRIHERAIPRSLTAILSRGRVRAVLELAGGTVARLGIRIGDRVRHAAFPP